MNSPAVARRYAQALFGARGGNGADVRRAYGELVAALRGEASLRLAVANPRIEAADKARVLRRLLPDAPPVLESFLRLLLERRREDAIEDIYEEYCRLADDLQGEAEAVVETALPLSDEDVGRLQKVLEQRFRKRLRVVPRVDPAVLGGVRVRVGDQLLDDTIRSRLTRVQQRLLAGTELGG